MEFKKIVRKVNSFQKGTFHSMVWEREIPVKKAFRGATVVKRTYGSGLRFGVEYDAMKAVQKGREDGVLPAENQGLKGREWIQENLFLKSTKTGKTLVRVSMGQNTAMRTEFFLNGQRVPKEAVQEMLYANDAKPHNTALNVFDVSTDAVISID